MAHDDVTRELLDMVRESTTLTRKQASTLARQGESIDSMRGDIEDLHQSVKNLEQSHISTATLRRAGVWLVTTTLLLSSTVAALGTWLGKD